MDYCLLQSPTLELAEYWLSSHPRNAPEPTKEIRSYIIASRKQARVSRRIWRLALTSIFTFMAATIIVLVGWINQDYVKAQWRWWTVTRPHAAAQVWPHVLTAAQEQALKPGNSFKECAKVCPEMIVVPAGSFTMGSPWNEATGVSPQHVVTFSKPFAVSKYELTFADWDACVIGGGCNGYRPNDQGWVRLQQPVINVSWDDAQQYVAWLSQVTGKPYRLLSESEYEFATRAGMTTAYPWGDDIGKNNANCNGCGSDWDSARTAPVGSLAPNKFGLYDMVGNVWEWVEDCVHYDDDGAPTNGAAWITGGDCSNRIIRGGSWLSSPNSLRSAFRYRLAAFTRQNSLGFRLGRNLY
jgi:formylglycine-generating enzyme required for sulfatase activity